MAQELSAADKLLEKLGLKFEDLDKPGYSGEREEYFRLLDQTTENPLTVERIKTSIIRMKYAVEMELTNPKIKHGSDEDRDLKARLRVYMMLEQALYAPQNAEENHRDDIARLLQGR